MTRAEWVDKAIRDAEKCLAAPPGWWGTYSDLHGPKGQRVRFSGNCWIVRTGSGMILSRHDSRGGAIAKARKL